MSIAALARMSPQHVKVKTILVYFSSQTSSQTLTRPRFVDFGFAHSCRNVAVLSHRKEGRTKDD